MVNAKHARPLAAFWLLALAAAIITALGLVGDRQGTLARHGSPIRVPSSSAPALVLGGVLHAQPNRTSATLLSAELLTPQVTAARAASAVRASEPSTPGTTGTASTTTHKARTKSGGSAHTTVQAQAAQNAQASENAQAPTSPDHGKGKHKSGEVARTTTTATTATLTATATSATEPKKGPKSNPKAGPKKGQGHGGRPDHPGKGNGKGH